jgi:hypothetical protein
MEDTMQQYKTTFYWGDRQGAYAHAAVAAKLTGGATVAETYGYWIDPNTGEVDAEDGATVTVIHDGGIVSVEINKHARLIAERRGESAVLRETVEVDTTMLRVGE